MPKIFRAASGSGAYCRFAVYVTLRLAGKVAGGFLASRAGTLDDRPPAALGFSSDELCPLLDNDRCSIYAQRPLICRTQGLPIGYIDEDNERIEVSACPLNFPEGHPFEYDDLLLLDTFNSRLAALNRSYCRAAEIATDLRLPLG